MDNHKVLSGLIIFLQILVRVSTYNFSRCNHDKIQEDLLNMLEPNATFEQEELQMDFHTCQDAPSPPAAPQHSQSRRAAGLLACALERSRGCSAGRWQRRLALWVVRRHCPGYREAQGGAAGSERRCGAERELMAVWRSYLALG